MENHQQEVSCLRRRGSCGEGSVAARVFSFREGQISRRAATHELVNQQWRLADEGFQFSRRFSEVAKGSYPPTNSPATGKFGSGSLGQKIARDLGDLGGGDLCGVGAKRGWGGNQLTNNQRG
ncbi:hypothetical protein Adt_17481 [Abeliophyllum distichum]|uniref:Uncharacterized protein n=1 Tax=Abeliophyllum distichum TaxID=126358 RepID=A0ABD1TGL9_9LAMI